MSDTEEPPTKMSKYTDLQYLDEDYEDILDEGQEEWLSEDELTDDYTATGLKVDNVLNESVTQEDNQLSMTTLNGDSKDTLDDSKTNAYVTNELLEKTGRNLEDTSNHLDGNTGNESRMSHESFTALLFGNTDSKLEDVESNREKENRDNSEVNKEEQEDDGNDTDDLLRLLSEDNQSSKKKPLKMVRCKTYNDGSTDDDEFIYERSKMKTLKLAKNALMSHHQRSKAMTRDETDSDLSSDEGKTVKKIFAVNKKTLGKVHTSTKNAEASVGVARPRMTPGNTNSPMTVNPAQKPKEQNISTEKNPKSILKTSTPKLDKTSSATKMLYKNVAIKTPDLFKPADKPTMEILDHEENSAVEYLEDENLDEEEFEGSDEDNSTMRIRNPESMDEEILSDIDSPAEDGIYDEMPSSESEDAEDWFELDIRLERATDYLPLLGSRARELLTAECKRSKARVATLKEALSVLNESARTQADELRTAAMELAELDDTLRAA